jgi:hypothetical protein
MIISLHKNNFTPFNLGLALQLCHGYGSKHLIETLHAFGICASYTEVRQLSLVSMKVLVELISEVGV